MPPPRGFTAIKDATTHQQIVSLLGVVVSVGQPRKTKGTDWVLDFDIQDDFTNSLVGGNATISCRMFRPSVDRFPKISGVGDVVILRNFKLNGFGLRMDCMSDSRSRSGVLVFPADKIPVPKLSHAYQLGNQRLLYSATFGTADPSTLEQMAVIHIKHAASGSLQQVQQYAVAASLKPAVKDRQSLIKDLVPDRFYDVHVQVVNSYYTLNGGVDLKVTDYTSNESLFYYADPAGEDAFMISDKTWNGPYGQLTMNVHLHESNAVWARENVSIGDFLFLRNMHARMSRKDNLEGVLHQDRQRDIQIDVRRLTNPAYVAEINQRREAYEKQRGSKSAQESLRDDLKHTSAAVGKSKKAEKRRRLKELKDAEQRDLEEKAEEWAIERSGVNKNIRAAFPEIKLSTISEIIYNPQRETRTAKYNELTLPFVNVKYRARVRVIDVFPPEIELFAHSTQDPAWSKRPKKQDANNSVRKESWEWGFILLLEDADVPRNTVSEHLRVVVANDAGQGLLKQNALDLKNSPHILEQVKEKFFILWGNMMELKTELRDRGSDLPLPPGNNRLQNKPFDCCIEEYGHEVPITKDNPTGYQRMHRLSQTFITS